MRPLCGIVLAALVFAPVQRAQTPALEDPIRVITDEEATWRLVWADEFDRPGLPDPEQWTYDVGGTGWGNRESQFYTDARTENARVEGGRLIIEARREEWHGSA